MVNLINVGNQLLKVNSY